MSRVLIPDEMTTAKLVSSTITEPGTGEAPYNPGTTYAIGNTCSIISGNVHNKFQSLVNDNLGNPPVPRPGTSAFWLHIGSTNLWNLFDLETNYKTSGTSPVNYVIAPGKRITAVAIGGMSADYAQLVIKNGLGVVLYDNTKDLRLRNVIDYYDYFHSPYYEVSLELWDNLPSTSDGTITLTLTGSGTLSLEFFAFGDSYYLGDEEFNAKDDVLNFSTVDRKPSGEITLIPKKSVPRPSVTMYANPELLQTIRWVRATLNAKPAIWNMYENQALYYHDSYLIKGIYKGFVINAENKKEAKIDIDLEGV